MRTTPRKTPVMIHRAVLGSFERFIGILIEHFGGSFPAWLSPEQVRVLPISEKTNDYALTLRKRLQAAGLRATADLSDEKIGAKIARSHGDRLPCMAVVGPQESQSGGVNVRCRGQKDGKTMTVDALVASLQKTVAERRVDLVLE
jgi:threonyl-tRNA synthetase